MSMDYFTEDHSKALLSQEWLVKVDNEKSVPYLMKFYSSPSDQSCIFLITDTKTVWAEVLSRAQLIRRWSTLNPDSASYSSNKTAEDEWLDQVLQYLSDVHSLSAFGDLSCEVTQSRYSDLALELRGEGFKWRWETFSLGPRLSAETLSKHLIMPLISTAHMAFTSKDPVGEISASDLEQAVDKVGRTARRSVDTHIKNAIMRPKISTTLRRMSALFDFNTSLPAILNEPNKPELKLPSAAAAPQKSDFRSYNDASSDIPARARSSKPTVLRSTSPTAELVPEVRAPGRAAIEAHATSAGRKENEAATDASVTEPDSDNEDVAPLPPKGKGKPKAASVSPSPDAQRSKPSGPASSSPAPSAPRLNVSAPRSTAGSRAPSKLPGSASDSPPRPKKKVKSAVSSSDEDSDGGPKHGGAGRRGTRQPIKRGGRRF